ncbi:Piso0_004997 [Millerozyma farinosa CBS 7064]|uniref:Ubiquitin carboxyl-terminal hydrolase n=1 Tax=Pichia sorbitophila (strain ATCC MYA-4447 / BCRC 22081 / CBS 7064 / NBRC 10061 / NRRL Y-12695) TaxID=559304 RepID=G8Y0Z9_PICSO|nr:Piso0_004997 [Millerozyma farinosa CBS 7064]
MTMGLPGDTGSVPYGDGSSKIFGMENFGNTCYCNSILQCLYYTEKFRNDLLAHNYKPHRRRTSVSGVRPHGFTQKYEQLVSKKAKEQPKGGGANTVAGDNIERPKPTKKGSLFGIRFNSSSSTNGSNGINGNRVTSSNGDDSMKSSYVVEARDCDVLSLEQRFLIQNEPAFQKLPLLVTRTDLSISNDNYKNNYSQPSSMLLNNDSPVSGSSTGNDASAHSSNKNEEMSVTEDSSVVVVGIPFPEPFSPTTNLLNPSVDQRKRFALIKGPIINLDTSLTPMTSPSDDSALLYALRDIYESMVENESQTGVVCPNYFITKLKEKNYLFRQNNMHHDAHEFCNYLINEIIECVDREVGPQNNWCKKLFQGISTNETKCLSCETITSKDEAFLDLSVDVPHDRHATSLTYSLNNFSKSETLTHQNKFYCNSCSSLQEATKTIKMKKLPEVLVINLKRFKYDDKMDRMVKLFDSISYPFSLRLFNTATSSNDAGDSFRNDHFSLYELYALVVHIGGGPMHGHYISLCKTKANLWLLFDDETVELVDASYVMRFFGNGPGLASAYILYYQKLDTSKSNDDEIDFGFNINDIYSGNDFILAQKQEPSHNNDTSSEISGHDASMSSTTQSCVRSTHDSEVQDPKLHPILTGLATTSVDPEPSATSPQNESPTTSKLAGFMKSMKSDKAGKDNESNVIQEKEIVAPKPEKKNWVNGLKRRESKLIHNLPGVEKNTSSASMKSFGSGSSNVPQEKEKRKSIFGFKRSK